MAGLATHRRIDLASKVVGDLHEVDATHVAGRREAREIVDHAAAQRVERGLAVERLCSMGVMTASTLSQSQGPRRLPAPPAAPRMAVGQGVTPALPMQRLDGAIGHQHGGRLLSPTPKACSRSS